MLWGPGSAAIPVSMRDWASDTMRALRELEKNDAPPAEEANARVANIQISLSGKWNGHSSGPFELGLKHFESAIAEQQRLRTPLNFDYEHASASCIPVHAPSSGYSLGLSVDGKAGAETLWSRTRLTKQAIAEVRDDEYRHISPTWMFDYPDRELGAPLEEHEDDWSGETYETGHEGGKRILAGLHSVALTNTPFLDGMQPITMALEPTVLASWRSPQRAASRHAAFGRMAHVAQLALGRGFSAGGLPRRLAEGTPTQMDDATLIAELYKITGTSTPEDLLAAVTEKFKAPDEEKPKDAPKPEGDAEAKLRAELDTTKTALAVALSTNERLTGELATFRDAEVNADVDAAMRAGRATEDQRAALTNVRRSSKDLFAQLTSRQVVPTTSDTKGPEKRKGAGPAKSGRAGLSTDAQRWTYDNAIAAGMTQAAALDLANETEG